MIQNLLRGVDQKGSRAMENEFPKQGVVKAVDVFNNTCTVDVGHVDGDGDDQYWYNVPYPPQNPPTVGFWVPLEYQGTSVHSVRVGMGRTNAQTGQVSGVVTSVRKSGAAKLIGDVTHTGVEGHTITQSGQNLEHKITDLGVTSAKIAADAVTTAKILDANVTDPKLATPYIKADGTRAFTGDQSMGSHKLTNVTDPTSAQDAATKAYVDSMAAGLDWKLSCRAATTANITLSGAQTIDGVSVIAGDRVLVKDQSTGSQNGIYVCASGAWSRATDADTSAEVTSGLAVFVTEGTANGDKGWVLTTNDPITLGTTALSFTQFTGSASPTGSAGGDLSGTYPNPTVSKIDGKTVDNTSAAPTDGQVLTWDNANNKYKPVTPSGGAPTGAQYVTLATDATLSAERVLAVDGLQKVDGGAGGNVTLSHPYWRTRLYVGALGDNLVLDGSWWKVGSNAGVNVPAGPPTQRNSRLYVATPSGGLFLGNHQLLANLWARLGVRVGATSQTLTVHIFGADDNLAIYAQVPGNNSGTISSSGTAVTGSGTSFQTHPQHAVSADDCIIVTSGTYAGHMSRVASVTNNTSLTLTNAFPGNVAAGSSWQVCNKVATYSNQTLQGWSDTEVAIAFGPYTGDWILHVLNNNNGLQGGVFLDLDMIVDNANLVWYDAGA